MLLPFGWPIRDHCEQLRAALSRQTKNFRKTQIVADERRNYTIMPGERHNLSAANIMFRFAPEAERINLAVAREKLAVRPESDRLVSSAPFWADGDNPAQNENAKRLCHIAQEGFGYGRRVF